MTKCKNCGKSIEYLTYHCDKCKREIAGKRPKKSKDLCGGCYMDYYNTNKNGCLSFSNSKVIIKDTYHSKSQVVPNPLWKLNCFLKEYISF
jgi:hypothetical protein